MKTLKFVAAALFTAFLTSSIYAAPGTPPPPPAAPPGFALPGVVIFLLAALGFGVYKHLNNPKK